MNRCEAIKRADDDPEIRAVIVTADGWVAVRNEATAKAAKTLFERSLHTDSDRAGEGQP